MQAFVGYRGRGIIAYRPFKVCRKFQQLQAASSELLYSCLYVSLFHDDSHEKFQEHLSGTLDTTVERGWRRALRKCGSQGGFEQVVMLEDSRCYFRAPGTVVQGVLPAWLFD